MINYREPRPKFYAPLKSYLLPIVIALSQFAVVLNAQNAALQLDKDSYLGSGLDGAHLLLNEMGPDFTRLRLSNSNYDPQTNNRFWDIAGSVGTISDGSTDALNFFNRGYGDVMSLRGNGNVGIGTVNPGHKLDIVGSLNLLKGQSIGSALFLNGISTIDLNQGVLNWGTGATYNIFEKNVGIGVTVPQKPLHVGGTIRSEDLKGQGNRRLVATNQGDIVALGGPIGTYRTALSPLEFRSSSNLEDSSFISTPEFSYSTKTGIVYAPLNLPHLANLTLVRFYHIDQDPLFLTDMNFHIGRKSLDSSEMEIMSVSPFFDPSSVPAFNQIDNANYTYFVGYSCETSLLNVTVPSACGSDVILTGVQIIYVD